MKNASDTGILKPTDINDFRKNGAVLLKGVFADQVARLEEGVADNLRNPGPYAAENVNNGGEGRFFDDYCNWQRIKAFEDFSFHSTVGQIAAELMGSEQVQLFHDHVLVKEEGTSKPTPWHQDSPYYFVDGDQTISFWCPLDPVDDATLRCVAGSHKWDRAVLPTRWLNESSFYPDEKEYMPVPDPDAEDMQILQWAMQPGDSVAFHFKTLHGAKGNLGSRTRRAFSLRVVGDDARYVQRSGKTSPPFPEHNMVPGQRLREDWFPVIYQR